MGNIKEAKKIKISVKSGWIVFILVSTIIFSLIVAGSDDWNTHKVLVQEAIYEDVPASETRINAYWVGATAASILVGIILGLVIYALLEEKEQNE